MKSLKNEMPPIENKMFQRFVDVYDNETPSCRGYKTLLIM